MSSTCSGVIPICSLANLLLSAGVPTISPLIVPSADLTVRTFDLGGNGMAADSDPGAAAGAAVGADSEPGTRAVSGADLLVLSCCHDAQPNKKRQQNQFAVFNIIKQLAFIRLL